MQALAHTQLVTLATTSAKVNNLRVKPAPSATAQKTVGNRFLRILLLALSASGA